MKTFKYYLKPSNYISFFILLLVAFSYGNGQELKEKHSNPDKPETELPPDIYWDVKAYRPEAELLKVKAIDRDGNMYDVKAIQNSDDTSVLDVKVLYNGQQIPIKLIIEEYNMHYGLKGIKNDGTLLDIKAITDDGNKLDVKGIRQSGNIVHIKAVTEDNTFYSIIAISPEGMVNSVKGVKMVKTKEETIINGVLVFAHVKALRQY